MLRKTRETIFRIAEKYKGKVRILGDTVVMVFPEKSLTIRIVFVKGTGTIPETKLDKYLEMLIRNTYGCFKTIYVGTGVYRL